MHAEALRQLGEAETEANARLDARAAEIDARAVELASRLSEVERRELRVRLFAEYMGGRITEDDYNAAMASLEAAS